MRIYVGNLGCSVGRNELRALFAQYGVVEDLDVPTDHETGRPRGFAFVTMADASAAQQAIDAINGTDQDGRMLKVNQARPKEDGDDGHW